MNNLLTQWELWGRKPKDPWNMISEKPSNLWVEYFLEGKPGGIKQEESLGLFCLLDGSGGPNKSATFLCQGRCGPRRLAFFCWRSCGPSHWWSHIDKEEGCYRLLWIILVLSGDKSLKVLDCRCRLPSILLLRIAFPQDKIIKPW